MSNPAMKDGDLFGGDDDGSSAGESSLASLYAFRGLVEGSVARSASDARSAVVQADHRCDSVSRASRSTCSPKEHERI